MTQERGLEPYIGVSGVGTPERQVAVENMWQQLDPREEIGRVALLGVKATTKTQLLERPTKYGPEWFPVGEALQKAIDPQHKRVGRAFIQLYIEHPDDTDYETLPMLDNVLERSQAWADGFQFDRLPWMDDIAASRSALRYVKENSEHRPVILQCYGEIMQKYSQEEVFGRLRRLADEGFIDGVLFDASEGKGKLMHVDQLSRWVESAKMYTPTLEVAVAGGLSAASVETHLAEVMRRCGSVSWDAESSLHNRDGGALNYAATSAYLRRSHAVITTQTHRTDSV